MSNRGSESNSAGTVNEAERLVFRALIAALAIGCVVALIFMLSSPGQEFTSALYLGHDSWTGYLSGNETTFTYGIKNYEGHDVNYHVRFFAAGNLIESEHVFVKNSGSIERAKTLAIAKVPEQYPFKIRVVSSAEGQGQSVFFWVKGTK